GASSGATRHTPCSGGCSRALPRSCGSGWCERMRGVTEHATDIKDPSATAKALTFFKIMAFIVGIGLLLLVLEVILHYGFDNEALSWWPQPHGFIYLLYVVSTANLGFKLRWSLGRMVL